nr:MAG TPA: hypothetical protein [Caudoviricetes sp.]
MERVYWDKYRELERLKDAFTDVAREGVNKPFKVGPYTIQKPDDFMLFKADTVITVRSLRDQKMFMLLHWFEFVDTNDHVYSKEDFFMFIMRYISSSHPPVSIEIYVPGEGVYKHTWEDGAETY